MLVFVCLGATENAIHFMSVPVCVFVCVNVDAEEVEREEEEVEKTFQQLYAHHKVIIELTSLRSLALFLLFYSSPKMWACSGHSPVVCRLSSLVLTLTDAHLIGGTCKAVFE